jgi:hypothetical protein
MKKTITIICALLAGGFMIVDNASNVAIANTSGSQGGYTGSISDGKTCGTSGGCHGGGAVDQAMITSDIPVTGYVPGEDYTVTITITQSGITKFGFEATAEDALGNQVGAITGGSGVNVIGTGGGTGHATHSASSTSGTGVKSWSFTWTAPAFGTGAVTIYGSGNAANSGNNTTGDQIYKDAQTFNEVSGVAVEENVSLIEFVAFPNPVQDVLNVKFDNYGASNMQLDLYDLQGRNVRAFHNGSIAGAKQQMSYNVSDLDAGIYLLNLTMNGNVYTQKVIVR